MGKDHSYTTVDKPIKVNKWDYLALKNTLDDAVKDVLITKYNHIENFSLIDCRCLMCTFAVIVAVFAIAWDFFNPFPKSWLVLTVCIALYFITMTAIILYITYIEKEIFAVTLERDKSGFKTDIMWEISSYITHTGIYHLAMVRKYSVGKDIRKRKISKSVANYFDEEGILCQNILENEVIKMREAILKIKKIE